MRINGLSRSLLQRCVLRAQSHSLYTRTALRPWQSAQYLSKRYTKSYATAITSGKYRHCIAVIAHRFLGDKSTVNPPPRYFRRVVTFLAIAIISTGAGFAMSVSPVIPTVNEFLSPLSDAESCTMFQPSTDKIAQEEAYIQKHPLLLELRSNPDFTESSPHMKIPAAIREHNLTAGALAGPGKLEVPPLQFVEKNGMGGITIFYIGTDLCGHPSLIHGGAMATLLDEALARCSFQALPNKIGMTANLNINYRKPLPAGSFAIIRSVTTKVEGRKAWVEGTLENLPANGEPKEVYCEASALFIEPRQAAVSKKNVNGILLTFLRVWQNCKLLVLEPIRIIECIYRKLS